MVSTHCGHEKAGKEGHGDSERGLCAGKRLTYVRYRDHVLFKKCDHSDMKPSVREVVGWLLCETSEAIYICCDRSVEPLPDERPSESGLIVLRSDILERRVIE